MRPSLVLAAAITAALPALARAQGGAPVALQLDARRLRLGADTLAVHLVQGADTTRTGQVVEELRTVTEDGRLRLLRVYASRDRVLGARLDSLTDDFATLAPVRMRSRTDRGADLLTFSADRVTGVRYLPNGDSLAVDVALPSAVLGSASFDLALRAAPLADGWQAAIPAYLPTTRSVVTLHARVAAAEVVAGTRCWRLEAEFTGVPVTFWVAQDSRRLVQQAMRLRPDVSILFMAPRPATPNGRTT